MARTHPIHIQPLGSRDAGRIRRLQRKLFPAEFREPVSEIRQILLNTEQYLVCNYSIGLYDDRRLVGYIFAYVETESIVYEREEEVLYLKEIGLLPGYEKHLRGMFSRLYRQWSAFTPGIPLEAHVVPEALDNWRRLQRAFRYYGLQLTDTVGDSPYRLLRIDVDPQTVALADVARPIRNPGWQYTETVTVTLVTDPAEWLSLRPAWDELVAETPDSNVFHSFDYLWQWWRYCGIWQDLRLFVIRRGERVIGAAPMMLRCFPVLGRTVRNLQFLTARMDMNRPKLLFGKDEQTCLAAFTAWLDAHPDEWDILDLDEQVAGEALTRIEAGAARARHLVAGDDTFCPCITLEGTWEDFLASRSSRMRSNVRRLRRRAADAGRVEVRCATDPQAVERAMDDYCRIEARSWKAAAGVDLEGERGRYFFNRALAKTFSEKGQFEIRTLEQDGRPIASTYGIAFDGVFHSLKIAHDEAASRLSPGTLLESWEIESLFDRSLRRYEFLGSFLQNKLRWTDEGVVTRNLHVFRRRPRLVLFYISYFVIRVRVKDALKRAGLFDRVHRLMLKLNVDPFPRYD